MTLQNLLKSRRRNPTIVQDDSAFEHQEVLNRIESLKVSLRPHRRVMVASGEAITVLSTMTACQSLDIPLWIGHEFSGPAVLDKIGQSQRIDVRVGNGCGLTPLPCDEVPEPGNFAVHIMTSGTTGTPKIARHTLDALMGRVSVGNIFSGCWLLTYPPSTFAGIQVLLTAIASNSTLVAYRTQNVAVMAAGIAKYGVTHASATPTFWRAALMVLPDSSHPSSLQQITIGGEIVDQALLDRLAARFPHTRIIHIYASTEAGALFSVKDKRAGFPSDWLSTKSDGVEMRVRNGLLEVRSPRSMRSYASGHTSPYSEDGWLVTGDRVEVAGDRVFFRGRNDQVINIGGAKVIPEEVERVVLDVEGVADACITGVKNPITGAVLKAEIVGEQGIESEQLRQRVAKHCHSVLPPHMVPRIIVIVPQLRMSGAGKKIGEMA